MNYRERVGQNINYYRKKNNLTLKDVANRLGVTESSIQKYEAGAIKRLDVDKLAQIAEAIGVTPEQLTGWLSAEEKQKAHLERVANRSKKYDSSFEGLSFDDQKQVMKYIKMLKSGSKLSPCLISSSEYDLIQHYRELNDEGKEKLLDALDDMILSGKYIKNNSSDMVDKSQPA